MSAPGPALIGSAPAPPGPAQGPFVTWKTAGEGTVSRFANRTGHPRGVTPPADDVDSLVPALEELRKRASGLSYPLAVDGAANSERERRRLTQQVEGYLLPRLRELDGPMIVAVGGPTGSGKSTLVNAMVGEVVTRAAVTRPTTRVPVLVCNPADADYFAAPTVLPRLRRTSDPAEGPGTLVLAVSAGVPAGLALLDTPDVDSVVAENRELARDLLASTDLWICVVSASRYADAVPWQLLDTARERGSPAVLVLDRVAGPAVDEITSDLAKLLREMGPPRTSIFVVPETSTDDAVLPADVVAHLRGWLSDLAVDPALRIAVLERTLFGVLSDVSRAVPLLAYAADMQVEVWHRLGSEVTRAYEQALTEVEQAVSAGELLRGEVVALWRQSVDTGALLRELGARGGTRLRDRVVAFVRGRRSATEELRAAIVASVSALVHTAADTAASSLAASWARNPAGAALIARSNDELRRPSLRLRDEVSQAVRGWLAHAAELAGGYGLVTRYAARTHMSGAAGLGLALAVCALAGDDGATGSVAAEASPPDSPPDSPTGAPAGSAGAKPGPGAGGERPDAFARHLLSGALGPDAAGTLVPKVVDDLRRRLDDLVVSERARFTAILDSVTVDADAAASLREALTAVEGVR